MALIGIESIDAAGADSARRCSYRCQRTISEEVETALPDTLTTPDLQWILPDGGEWDTAVDVSQRGNYREGQDCLPLEGENARGVRN